MVTFIPTGHCGSQKQGSAQRGAWCMVRLSGVSKQVYGGLNQTAHSHSLTATPTPTWVGGGE